MHDESSHSFVRVPKWLAIVIVVLICWFMVNLLYSVTDGRHATVNKEAKLISECIPVDANEKSVLIAIAGFLAQRNSPEFIRQYAEKAVPEIRGMENAKAAEWIVRHYDQFQFDSKTHSFRTNAGVTTQP